MAFDALALAVVTAPAKVGTPDELLNRPLALVVALALVGLLPFLLMTLTSFVKISTVLHIARSAIGVPEVPSSTVVIALAAALTFLAMAPVANRIADRITPLLEPTAGETTGAWFHDAVVAVREPLRGFLSANASPRQKTRFFELSKKAHADGDHVAVERDDLGVVVPAFLVSELVRAFTLGFAIYLPFLVVDLVVANVLAALGMQTLNPIQVSLPFKLLLFVAADGWGLLAQALVLGYKVG
ncbi:MAG TPA: EscR/YscR/HrcR family type III secretion system export apparatus protein [Polyangiaceae bacterium]|nr:EscR/YscR/HrcR family type III secretion system export apparatus protein [Polyangiaceae bacterium]